ncbi:MAG: bifunctional transaldolase/phosoglucose isomerase [Bryobacteraceae bacterium]|jgi:transaldolase/glucose-6-phosphate isomerase
MADKKNNLVALADFGQSFWLDYIRRSFVEGGELAQMIAGDGLRGLTSNPSIFEKAIGGSTDYRAELDEIALHSGNDAQKAFERLAQRDIRNAADLLRPVYDATQALDGYVSLEVSPELAHSSDATISQARDLWKLIDRPNLMVKVPGTKEGIPAIARLIADGLNINVTLLFAVGAYEEAAEAFLQGLEERAAKGLPIDRIASVASFFVSRIDTAIDKLLQDVWKNAPAADRTMIEGLLGKAAIANAKRAYARFQKIFSGPRWEALEKKGARPQRLLWASTSTKNPSYRDVIYIEELIGQHTVNTMPPATAAAFRDHGVPRNALVENPAEAEHQLSELARLGISLDDVTNKLLADGVEQFSAAWRTMLDAIRASMQPRTGRQQPQLPEALSTAVAATVSDWGANAKVKRLWDGDATLWTGDDEAKWLGWLRIAHQQIERASEFRAFAEEVKGAGFQHAVVLGMGGSSLAPEVLARTFGQQPGFPRLAILDSTDPAQVRALEETLDLTKTLFIVSSKSGSTLEPNLYYEYFRSRVEATVGAANAGRHFVAVTDPGSNMETVARNAQFRHIFHGVPSIGGRYSALSNFGMIPAAAAGLDVERLLQGAEQMVQACASCVPAAENPGLQLGALLGTLGRQGRDKVTIIASPAIADLGAWLEQLIAESTGKNGKGLIPVDAEPLGPPEVYGSDRVFAYVRFAPEPDIAQDAAVDALSRSGQPVVHIDVADRYDLGAEFFRWEFATAVAGSVLGINPFNQPDVEASKIATRKLTEEFEATGHLPPEDPFVRADGGLSGALRAHLDRAGAGDYVALLAYIPHNDAHTKLLEEARLAVRDAKHLATCVGFGPRFLHSTGQAYKGGPNSGVFVQITCDDANDVAIPGRRYTFGVVKAAQARGDYAVLAERHRRLLRVHIGADVAHGLATLRDAIASAVGTAVK